MRWKPKTHIYQNDAEYSTSGWKKWFAWHPVPLGDTGEKAWLEYVWRRVGQGSFMGPIYEYELYLGEQRQLPPERLRPHLQESIFRAKQYGHPVVHFDGMNMQWVHPAGNTEPANEGSRTAAVILAPYLKRTPTTMGEAVAWAQGYPEKFKAQELGVKSIPTKETTNGKA